MSTHRVRLAVDRLLTDRDEPGTAEDDGVDLLVPRATELGR